MVIAVAVGFIAAGTFMTVLAVGAYLVWVGLRARKGDHSRCRTCGFDLCGHAVTPRVCPECGHLLRQAHATVIGRHHLHAASILTGLTLVVLGVAPFVVSWHFQRPVSGSRTIVPAGAAPATVTVTTAAWPAPRGDDQYVIALCALHTSQSPARAAASAPAMPVARLALPGMSHRGAARSLPDLVPAPKAVPARTSLEAAGAAALHIHDVPGLGSPVKSRSMPAAAIITTPLLITLPFVIAGS